MIMIKKLSIIGAAALLSLSPLQAREITDDEAQRCELVGLIAKAIMTGRQEGVTAQTNKATVMRAIKSAPHWATIVDNMIEEAYARPVFSTIWRQSEIEVEFWMDWEQLCRDEHEAGLEWGL
jgi:ribonucleotide reductase beta subunit family protein with ferritin-like domain